MSCFGNKKKIDEEVLEEVKTARKKFRKRESQAYILPQKSESEYDSIKIRAVYCLEFLMSAEQMTDGTFDSEIKYPYLEPMIDAGLEITLLTHDGMDDVEDEISRLILIECDDDDVLCKYAEKMKLPMKSIEHLGIYFPFEKDMVHTYEPYNDNHLFSSGQKLQIMEFIMYQKCRKSGEEISLGVSIERESKHIKNLFPLHEPQVIRKLDKLWIRSCTSQRMSLDKVRDYFGEKLALYFLWIGYYTQWLLYASIAGIGVFYIQVMFGFLEAGLVFNLFLTTWVTFYLEFWKRRCTTQSWIWNTLDHEREEKLRPEYKTTKHNLQFYEGKIITPYFVKTRKNFVQKWAISLPTVIFFTILCLGVAVSIIVFKLAFEKEPWGSTAGSIINAVVIIILENLYFKIAVKLNDMENHVSDTKYADGLISKLFGFQFVNSYSVLFYIAFVKSNAIHIFGYPMECKGFGDLFSVLETNSSNACLEELSVNLMITFLVRLIVLQILEQVLPILNIGTRISNLIDRCKGTYVYENSSEIPFVRKQANLPEFVDTLTQYNEIVIQFGYIVLFGSVFPLAPLASLLNNWVEIRADAFSYLHSMQRRSIEKAGDIGTWYDIMELMSFLGILTNCCIIAFTDKGGFLTAYEALILAFVVENIILALKYILNKMIETKPGFVRWAEAKEHYLKLKIAKDRKKLRRTMDLNDESEFESTTGSGNGTRLIDDKSSSISLSSTIPATTTTESTTEYSSETYESTSGEYTTSTSYSSS
eukprot:TRINITY_DN7758_c0_g1_i1.p1 TRINITY_DN7758_c0_g1~~TRINITY_DN7758_c0_g1_i1.p1  ORF type:complete len:760 (-),score=109.46 TRINITY_DN7758_c0_g1_i1:727-3006(-)